MTATEDQAAVNGQHPAEPGPGPQGANLSERVLGVFGIALAAVLLGIGLDMLTGGQMGLSRLIAAVAPAEQADGDGG